MSVALGCVSLRQFAKVTEFLQDQAGAWPLLVKSNLAAVDIRSIYAQPTRQIGSQLARGCHGIALEAQARRPYRSDKGFCEF
jgi:hypothetical protein